MQRPRAMGKAVIGKMTAFIMGQLKIDSEEVAEDIISVLSVPTSVSAAVVAMESHGWSPTPALLDAFAQAFGRHEQFVKQAIAEWVQASRVLPQKKVGDVVSLNLMFLTRQVEIVAVDQAIALYQVVEKEGQDQAPFWMPYEVIHPLAEPPEAFSLRV